jgi:transposase
MNNEPTKISSELLELLINREFADRSTEVPEQLKQVKSDSESGRRRISAAILKLANRSRERLEQLIQRANSDFRDIIAQAEYPRVFEAGFGELTEGEERKANEADWKEYQNWLNEREA